MFLMCLFSADQTLLKSSVIASDGHYLYIHNASGLHKVGSGFGSTIRGVVYEVNPTLASAEVGWLGYASGRLFYCRSSATCSPLTSVDCKTLHKSETFAFSCKFNHSHLFLQTLFFYISRYIFLSFLFIGETFDQLALFSDGEVIGQIAASLDVRAKFSKQRDDLSFLSLKRSKICLGEFCVENVQREVQPHAASE